MDPIRSWYVHHQSNQRVCHPMSAMSHYPCYGTSATTTVVSIESSTVARWVILGHVLFQRASAWTQLIDWVHCEHRYISIVSYIYIHHYSQSTPTIEWVVTNDHDRCWRFGSTAYPTSCGPACHILLRSSSKAVGKAQKCLQTGRASKDIRQTKFCGRSANHPCLSQAINLAIEEFVRHIDPTRLIDFS